jgi:hypothetical protein
VEVESCEKHDEIWIALLGKGTFDLGDFGDGFGKSFRHRESSYGS